MMKDLSDWVRECWVSWSRPPILAMKVCLPGHVTAMPSISFRNLQCHNMSSDKSAVSTIVMVPPNHIVISKDQRVGDKFKSRQTWLDQWPMTKHFRYEEVKINNKFKLQASTKWFKDTQPDPPWHLSPRPRAAPCCTVLTMTRRITQIRIFFTPHASKYFCWHLHRAATSASSRGETQYI